jgi:hypothetical protein
LLLYYRKALVRERLRRANLVIDINWALRPDANEHVEDLRETDG